MANVSSSTGGTGFNYVVTPTIAVPVVNNALYSYAIQVNLQNSLQVGLVTVRVDYTYQTLVPIVDK